MFVCMYKCVTDRKEKTNGSLAVFQGFNCHHLRDSIKPADGIFLLIPLTCRF